MINELCILSSLINFIIQIFSLMYFEIRINEIEKKVQI